jgi:hypothetical protein
LVSHVPTLVFNFGGLKKYSLQSQEGNQSVQNSYYEEKTSGTGGKEKKSPSTKILECQLSFHIIQLIQLIKKIKKKQPLKIRISNRNKEEKLEMEEIVQKNGFYFRTYSSSLTGWKTEENYIIWEDDDEKYSQLINDIDLFLENYFFYKQVSEGTSYVQLNEEKGTKIRLNVKLNSVDLKKIFFTFSDEEIPSSIPMSVLQNSSQKKKKLPVKINKTPKMISPKKIFEKLNNSKVVAVLYSLFSINKLKEPLHHLSSSFSIFWKEKYDSLCYKFNNCFSNFISKNKEQVFFNYLFENINQQSSFCDILVTFLTALQEEMKPIKNISQQPKSFSSPSEYLINYNKNNCSIFDSLFYIHTMETTICKVCNTNISYFSKPFLNQKNIRANKNTLDSFIKKYISTSKGEKCLKRKNKNNEIIRKFICLPEVLIVLIDEKQEISFPTNGLSIKLNNSFYM